MYVFIDTVCWIALLNRQDQFHDVADKHYKNMMRSGIFLLPPLLFSMKPQTHYVILHSNLLLLPFIATLRLLHGLRLYSLILLYGRKDGNSLKNGRINHGVSRTVSPFPSCRNGKLAMYLPVTGILYRPVFTHC